MRHYFQRATLALIAVSILASIAVAQECIDYQPNEMEILDTLGLQGLYLYEVEVEGDVAFVGTAYYLHTVDISDPGNLRLLESIQYNGLNLAVHNGLVCLATQDDEMHFIDATDPSNMTHVTTIAALDGLQNVIAHGDHFYAGANHLGVYTVDASDPTNPVLASNVNVDERVVDLAAAENYLYSIGYDSDMCVFSLTDPDQPEFVSVGNTYYNGGWELLVNGDYVYLASISRGLTVMDVHNPGNPFRVTTIPTQGNVSTLTMIGDMLFGGPMPMVQPFDVTDPSAPVQVGRLVSNRESWSLASHGQYLIGVDGGNTLFSADVSQPVSTLPLANHSTGGDARNIIFDGSYGYVANGNQGLFIRNINSATPVSETPLLGFLHNVTIDGNLAYLAMDDRGMQIADISDPAAPVLLDDINTSGHAMDVAIYHHESGTYALVADDEYDMSSYDATDPTYIRPKGVTYFPGHVFDIEVYGDYALVADHTGELHVVDVSHFPDPPQIMTSLEVPGTPRDLLLQGDILYVSGGRFINSVDLSNPLAPQILDTLDTSANVVDVAVKDGVAYLSLAGFGMDIVDVSDPGAMQFMSEFGSLGGPIGLDVYEERVFLCKGDQGISILPLQCLLSPVGDDLPGVNAGLLSQAYPNPFNPRTTIAYELPQIAEVDLRVYDLAGRLVRTLASGEIKDAGRHTVQWNGQDNAGGAAPSGVYLYRLKAAGHLESRRMVLLR